MIDSGGTCDNWPWIQVFTRLTQPDWPPEGVVAVVCRKRKVRSPPDQSEATARRNQSVKGYARRRTEFHRLMEGGEPA